MYEPKTSRSYGRLIQRAGKPVLVFAGLLLLVYCLLNIVRAVHAGFGDNALINSEVKSYNDEVSKNYDFKFGSNPFSPSNATSTTGKFIPGEMFISSARCGTCHTDAHAQWRQSAHGNAFREPFYQKNVK
ncbi:MAG: cytochrome c family protein, partial [Acidobacteriota bacterium]|nr:cytochrome c family protein [Acidobacteriota bacterium]